MSSSRLPTLVPALLLAAAAGAQVPDPFAAHVRWIHSSSTGSAWLPAGLDFAAGGELVWASGQGSSPRAMALSTAPVLGAAALPSTLDVALAGAAGSIDVACGPGEGELYSAAQYVVGTPLQRRTEVARHDARAGAVPLWRRNLPLVGNGIAELAVARDGSRVVAATHDAQFQVLVLEWLDASSGAPAASRTVGSGTLRRLAASADLTRVALVAGAELRVYDDGGALLHAELGAAATSALAISGDGRTVAYGSADRVRLLRDAGGVWQAAGELAATAPEVATRVALDDAGATLAIGWWNATTTRAVRLQLWELAAPQLAYERLIDAPASPLQNLVEAVELTPDGARAAFGCWGSGDGQPEVLLVDRASGAEVLARDLPGSVRALALDAGGTRLAVGAKHVHANQLGSTGEVLLLDSGERDLQLVAQPLAGGQLRLAAKLPGARRVYFLIGSASPSPVTLAGGGALWIERSSALRYVRPADASGRADLVLPLSPASAGNAWSVQALARTGGLLRASATVVAPVIF
jgi:hypothetical protein